MMLFLKPMAETLSRLYSEGKYTNVFVYLSVTTFNGSPKSVGFQVSPPNARPFVCHAVLITSTCDLAAKAQVMNMVQFNGFYSCSLCLQKGVSNNDVNTCM